MASLFIQWLYIDAPKAYVNYAKLLSMALFNYFSVPLLASSLFQPWRHDAVDITRLPMRYWSTALFNNITSRMIGFMVRGGTIFIGIMSVILTNIGFMLFLAVWYTLPLLLIYSVIRGITYIAGGGL